MHASRDADRLERDLAALAPRRLDGHALRSDLAERIRRAVPADGYCLSSADPVSLCATACAAEGVDRSGAPALYAAEHAAQGDAARHADLARARVPVRVLSQATSGALDRSVRYRTVLAPMGIRHELRAALRSGGRTWGFLHLFRSAEARDFDAAEAALVERVAPLAGALLRSCALRPLAGPVPAAHAPALLVLDRAGRLVERSPGADERLAALRDPAAPDLDVPEILVTLGIWARVLAAHGDPQAAHARLPGNDGRWHDLHATVTDRDRVAVIAGPVPAAALVGLRLEGHGLSAGERDVVRLAMEGRSTKEIAEELVLSAWTVQDRLKRVFEKVGVRSRRELVARLMGDAS